MVDLNFRDGTRGVTQKALYEAAHTKFNLDQIAYDTAIARADPKIVARKLIAAAAYAPESEAVRSATESEIEPSGTSHRFGENPIIEALKGQL